MNIFNLTNIIIKAKSFDHILLKLSQENLIKININRYSYITDHHENRRKKLEKSENKKLVTLKFYSYFKIL